MGAKPGPVCVCVSVTALAGATSPLKAKVRYQQKAHDIGNKTNLGIELKILSSKFMTVVSLPFTRCFKATEEGYWYIKRCICVCTCI